MKFAICAVLISALVCMAPVTIAAQSEPSLPLDGPIPQPLIEPLGCQDGLGQSGGMDAKCNFSILNRIDTSPAFSLQSSKKHASDFGASKIRSLINFMFDTRGTDWSKEGADVASDNKGLLASVSTKAYQDQIHRDEIHWLAVSLMARIASSSGDAADGSQSQARGASIAQLRALIGATETNAVLKGLSSGGNDQARSEVPQVAGLDLSQVLDAQDVMLGPALDKDPVIATVSKELTQYGRTGKGRRVATKVAYSVLGAAAFVPNWVAPIAETAFLGTMMANGGPEQDKLLKELYWAKRLEKRRDLIQREVNLALHSREISLATGNVPLYRFSKGLVDYLCGEDMERSLFPEEMLSVTGKQSTASVLPAASASHM